MVVAVPRTKGFPCRERYFPQLWTSDNRSCLLSKNIRWALNPKSRPAHRPKRTRPGRPEHVQDGPIDDARPKANFDIVYLPCQETHKQGTLPQPLSKGRGCPPTRTTFVTPVFTGGGVAVYRVSTAKPSAIPQKKTSRNFIWDVTELFIRSQEGGKTDTRGLQDAKAVITADIGGGRGSVGSDVFSVNADCSAFRDGLGACHYSRDVINKARFDI